MKNKIYKVTVWNQEIEANQHQTVIATSEERAIEFIRSQYNIEGEVKKIKVIKYL